MKSIGIVHIHLRKMPLKFWGIVPTPSGPWGLRSDGHHGWGGLIKMAGRIKDVGIQYILRRNSTGGVKNNL